MYHIEVVATKLRHVVALGRVDFIVAILYSQSVRKCVCVCVCISGADRKHLLYCARATRVLACSRYLECASSLMRKSTQVTRAQTNSVTPTLQRCMQQQQTTSEPDAVSVSACRRCRATRYTIRNIHIIQTITPHTNIWLYLRAPVDERKCLRQVSGERCNILDIRNKMIRNR